MTDKNIIAIEKKGEKLSKLQTQFNSYTQKIDALKIFITQAKTNMDFARNLHNEKLIPIYMKMRDIDMDIVFILDKHFDAPKANKTFKKNISYYLVAELPMMINSVDESEKLEEMYQKHNGASYEDEVNQKNDEMNQKTKDFFGFDITDEDAREEFFKNTFGGDKNNKKSEKNENHEQREAKKKTAAQVARELKAEEEAKNIGQASRKIYTELVKQFHPDREHDELERERKTEIMKRITLAYEKNDLFDLLKLQLEYLQIDKDHINKLADDKLKYYNKILKEQLEELQDELSEVTESGNPFQMSFFDQYCRGTESEITKRIEKERKSLNKDLKGFEDKRSFLYDADAAAHFLKDFKQEREQEMKVMKSMNGMFRF